MKILPRNQVWAYVLLEEILNIYQMRLFTLMLLLALLPSKSRKRKKPYRPYCMIGKMPSQNLFLSRMVRLNDTDCLINIRMDRNAFGRLCKILRDLGGLQDGKYVVVEEQVAIFLSILAHHQKNQVVGFNFQRSGQTISQSVHAVLRAIIKLHPLFLVNPTPVPEESVDPRWKWFPGCLGALDGTYIHVQVRNCDKPRYRNRKGHITTNTLAVCDHDLKFVYVLPGWEGSAADGRVLRDALNRPHGLRVPTGCYYLCDNAYANSEGFLTPYKGVRYHLKEWGPESSKPQSPEEIFNMRHTKARNVVERAFGVLKMRWGILRSASYYPIKTQTRLIMACFLLHNYIRSEMPIDPIEDMMDAEGVGVEADDGMGDEFMDNVQTTTTWNQKRQDLANKMWQNFVECRNA